ncbi:hypothetical protein WDW86_16140 [Bdellovibrionota bacterium FG-2]
MQIQTWPLFLCLLATIASPVAFGMAKPVPTAYPPGYGPLSKAGSKLLNSLVSNREWRISRDTEWMAGSAREREIYQKLQLSRSGGVASKDVSEDVYGWSFTFAASAFGPEVRGENVSSFNANQLLTVPGYDGYSETSPAGGLNESDFLFEQATSDGSYRFRFRFYLDVRFPILDYALSSSSENLSLYPSDKICAGTVCRSLQEVNLTKTLSPEFLVLEFNPKKPGKMIVEASDRGAQDGSVFKFHYDAPVPVEPIAVPNLCFSYSCDELREVRTGFKCRLSKLDGEGAVNVFERVERAGFGEAWKDPSGLIWSDILGRSTKYQQAEKVCADVGGRLPTPLEESRMRGAFVQGSTEGKKLLPNFNQVSWMKDGPETQGAWIFSRLKKRPVRCVFAD